MLTHPWAIVLGSIAVALPVAIHWLTRPKPIRLPLSTLRFVRQAVHQRRARHRLRDWLVLALRTLAIVFLALAMARPRWGEQPLVSPDASARAMRVVIVDVSQSMAALHDGVALIERARTAASRYLDRQPGLQVNLILAAARAESVFDHPSRNFEALREALGTAKTRCEPLDVNDALAEAGRMLSSTASSDVRCELVVVSDFQRSNWARANFSSLPQSAKVQFESIAPAEALPNLALLRAEVRGRATVDLPSLLEIDVANYSELSRNVTVEVTIGGATHRLEGVVPAGEIGTLSQQVVWQQSGWELGLAKLVGAEDALPPDDVRAMVVRVVGPPSFAIVTRHDLSDRPTSSYFLERALTTSDRWNDTGGTRVVRVDPDGRALERLMGCDLMIIDHPGKLDTTLVHRLTDLLRRGRPLLYVASEAVDATNLRAISDACGDNLRMPVDFLPPQASDQRRALFLTSFQRDEAPFDVLGESAPALLGKLRFAGGLPSRRRDGAVSEDVLASYGDGSAGLIVTTLEAGTFAVWNADLGLSNLVTTELFVPILDQLVQRLLQRDAASHSVVAGQPLVVRIADQSLDHRQLRIVADNAGPELESELGELASDGTGVTWRWAEPRTPGAYRLEKPDGQVVHATSVVIDMEESNLLALDAELLRNRLARGLATHYRSAGGATDENDNIWSYLLMACVVCSVIEFLTLTKFRT